MAQDDYYYEIQLTNKQLVFYFVAGAMGLILSFLAGVMVGRGVDASGGDVQASRPGVQEDRLVPEEAPARPASPPAAEDLTYPQRLEGEKVDESLERPKPSAPPAEKAPAKAPAKATPSSTAKAEVPPAPTPAKPTAAPKVSPVPTRPAGGAFTIQVGAFKERAAAESVVARLKAKGFAAYVVSPEGAQGGLFNVRVGSYPARADAERVQARLRDEEKLKPFIVQQ